MAIMLIIIAVSGFGLGWWVEKLRVRRELWLEDGLRRDGFAEELIEQLRVENTALRKQIQERGASYTTVAQALS